MKTAIEWARSEWYEIPMRRPSETFQFWNHFNEIFIDMMKGRIELQIQILDTETEGLD